MSDNCLHHCGLTRRELERECAWLMRRLPDDPDRLAKLLAEVIVALIDKNNAAIAKHQASQDDHKPGAQ